MAKLKEEDRLIIERELSLYNFRIKKLAKMYKEKYGDEDFNDLKEYKDNVCVQVNNVSLSILQKIDKLSYLHKVKMDWEKDKLICRIQTGNFAGEINFSVKGFYRAVSFKNLDNVDSTDSAEKFNNVRE